MEYKLKIKNDEKNDIPIQIDIEDGNKIKAGIKQEIFDINYSIISDHHIYLNINGKGINAYMTDADDGKLVFINGITYFIQDMDKIALSKAYNKELKNSPAAVTPPMPAVVVNILVKENDVVEKDQGLIVISAMKMETTLTAPYNGKVAKINTSQGEKVMPGQILIDVEKTE